MPSIQLQAKLRAYTRAPFYTDVVREAPEDDVQYVRINGEWKPLDTALLQGTVEEFRDTVNKLRVQLDAVDLQFIPSTNQLVFIDGYGSKTYLTLPGTNVDGKTIGLTNTNSLYVIDTPDDITIKTVDIETVPHPDDESIQKKISGKLRVDAIYAEDDNYLSGKDIFDRLQAAEKNINDIEQIVQGTGGFLDPADFYNNQYNPTDILLSFMTEAHRNSILSVYAHNQLHTDTIPNQTKIKDIRQGYVWIWNGKTWINDGQDGVVNANNEGVLGVVRGVKYIPTDTTTKFKISIEEDSNRLPTGIMSVNGLQDEFDKVLYLNQTAVQPDSSTFVQRSFQGTVKTQDSQQPDDAINRREFTSWQESMFISSSDIKNIVNVYYVPKLDLDSEVH